MRAAIMYGRPTDEPGKRFTYDDLLEIVGGSKSDLERMLDRRRGELKRATPQQIRKLADAVGLPEAFFYADFTRLAEIVPQEADELAELRRIRQDAEERERELLAQLDALKPTTGERLAAGERERQALRKEAQRSRGRQQDARDTKRGRANRRDEG